MVICLCRTRPALASNDGVHPRILHSRSLQNDSERQTDSLLWSQIPYGSLTPKLELNPGNVMMITAVDRLTGPPLILGLRGHSAP